jgi:hypothetical protein
MDDSTGKVYKKRTPVGTKRVSSFLFIALAVAVLYYVNFILPESTLVSGRRRAGLGASKPPPATTLTQAQVDAIVSKGPPTNVGHPEDPPREPNTAICNESVLEGVMSVARQQSQRAINMYEQERKRREEQDILLDKATRRAEDAERELNELKAKLKDAEKK